MCVCVHTVSLCASLLSVCVCLCLVRVYRVCSLLIRCMFIFVSLIDKNDVCVWAVRAIYCKKKQAAAVRRRHRVN